MCTQPGSPEPSSGSLVPALFLDRDGVIHREIGYLYQPHQVEFLPGIFELCHAAQSRGFKIIIITNQSGIARGFYTEADFHRLMGWMTEEFRKMSITIDGYYFCPHHPDGIAGYQKDCGDRKPHPGMILRAAAEHGLDLRTSVLVGDRCSDIQAGAAAGITQLFLLAGTEPEGCKTSAPYTTAAALPDITSRVA